MAAATEETFEFKTEIKELMHLIVHTLYTHKEIFLRELLSNASDALSKVQFEALTNPDIYDKDQVLDVKLSIDEKKKLLTIEDTGVGMTREQLISQIGTIAHSGTKRFMKELSENEKKDEKDKKSLPDLIGQFGVGFYSAFMVADKVSIETKSMEREAPAVAWESDGTGSYVVKESERRKRGTSITLHLKKEAKEFLEESRIKSLVEQYSNYLPFPVLLGEEEVNKHEALWRKSKKDLKEEDYNEFYKQVSTDWQEPLHYEHFSGDAPVQFSSVLYIPKRAPMEYYGQDPHEHGLKLYVKRVFIQDDCKALLPRFLRFLRGVVESEDLPLNVSRESIQNDANITKINKVLTKKFLSALKKMSTKKEELYLDFWKQFGRFIKEGVHSETTYKDKLLPLVRFYTSKHTDNPTGSFADYIANKKEDQKAVYYAVGEKVEQLRRSPHLELFQRNDIEVILLTEPMDDMIFNQIGTHEDMKLINVESGDLELPEDIKKEVEEVEVSDDLTRLKDKVKEVLSDHVNEVRFSKALSDSPCKFYNASGGISHNVQKLMFNMDGMSGFPLKRDLELNPEHSYVKALAGRLDNDSVNDQIKMLFHMASLLEGTLEDPQELAGLVLPLLR
ncbi:MAG: molecular chaperone HtpG [Acidobacteriota bacterium]|nr:molecular chaperone HtpG [Acidobacteriota bacterium]